LGIVGVEVGNECAKIQRWLARAVYNYIPLFVNLDMTFNDLLEMVICGASSSCLIMS